MSASAEVTCLVIAGLLSVAVQPGSAGELLKVDDSYTVSQRYERNKDLFPALERPVVQFREGQRVHFDRRYKQQNGRELHIDVFLPAAAEEASRRAVMLIHGGGWRSGNKSHLYPLANLLAQAGYVVLLPEYRLSTEARYPAGLVDLNDAIVWAKAHADEFAFSPRQLALGGASSGGQMAALLAYTSNRPWFKSEADQDTSVMALIDLDGVLDFTTPLAIRYENRLKNQSAAGLWFGGAMETTPEKWQQASAARHVHAQAPATLIISSGQPRFTAGREQVMRELETFGIANDYVEYDGILHTFWLFEPYVRDVAARIDGFLRKANPSDP